MAGGHGLAGSGVLLHQFDTTDSYDPIRASGPSWLLSTEEREWSDRIAATLVNARLRNQHEIMPLYSDVTAGVVLNPMHVNVMCSYSSDGGTQHVKCNPPGRSEDCTPGCSDREQGPRSAEQCFWGEHEIGHMLMDQLKTHHTGAEKRYNEIILDASDFRKSLPQAIEAVFFIGVDSSIHCQSANHWASARGHCERFAHDAHKNFLRQYGLRPETVPLLRLDVHLKTANPFSLADEPWADPVMVSKSGEMIERVCLSELRAREISCTNAINRKGTNCKPQLWVYEGQGNFKTLQKTRATELIEGTKRAGWEGESFCVSLQPRIDRRVCFDLRDAGGATNEDDDDPLLLHFGCVTVTANSLTDGEGAGHNLHDVDLIEYSVSDRRASVHFAVHRAT